ISISAPQTTLTATHTYVSHFFIVQARPPISTLFPYTTLFRSIVAHDIVQANGSFAQIAGEQEGETVQAHTEVFCLPVFQSTHSRSEEHTSELQSQSNLVCRLLLEKKKFIVSSHMNYDTITLL